MPLDHNIILAGLRNQDDGQSMIQAFQAGQGIAARRQQMQAQQMQMDEAQRQQMSQQAVDSALSHYSGQGGQIDREGVARYLGLRGEGRALQGLQQNWMQSDAAQAKAQREAAKAELENKIKQADFQARTAGAALAAYQRGDMQTPQALWQQSGMQGQFDPNMAFGMLRQGVEAKDMFSQEWDRQKFGEEMGFKKGESEAKRGMEEKKFAADQAESKQRLAQGWAGINLQREKLADDRIQAGKGGKMTEQQSNALGFGMRATESDAIMRGLEQRDITGGDLATKVLGWMPGGNFVKPAEVQQAEQAKMNFITAVLRKESGAAIGADEFRKEDLKYFGQPGDSKEAIAQKQRARELAINVLKTQAGREIPKTEYNLPTVGSGPASNNVKPGTTYTDPDDGTVYVSIGGPRNDPKTWKKR